MNEPRLTTKEVERLRAMAGCDDLSMDDRTTLLDIADRLGPSDEIPRRGVPDSMTIGPTVKDFEAWETEFFRPDSETDKKPSELLESLWESFREQDMSTALMVGKMMRTMAKILDEQHSEIDCLHDRTGLLKDALLGEEKQYYLAAREKKDAEG